MKKKLITTISFLLLSGIVLFTKSYASLPKDGYFWIEYGDRTKEKDGSLTQVLKLNYGIYPDTKISFKNPGSLIMYYSADEQEYYESKLIEKDNEYFTKINTFKTHRFNVFAQAQSENGKSHYLAKTCFVLFGPKTAKDNTRKRIGYKERLFDIEVLNRSYWPQTGMEVKIVPLFNKNRITGKKLNILDETFGHNSMKTGEDGTVVYTAPHDKKLNMKGTAAFKQTVIAAKHKNGDDTYKTSYTLIFHRSRFVNHRYIPGWCILFFSACSAFAFILFKRKGFRV